MNRPDKHVSVVLVAAEGRFMQKGRRTRESDIRAAASVEQFRFESSERDEPDLGGIEAEFDDFAAACGSVQAQPILQCQWAMSGQGLDEFLASRLEG